MVAPQTDASAAVPVIALSLVRGSTPDGAPPATQVSLPADASHVVLLIDLGDASYPAYRMTMTSPTSGDTIVWRGEHVVPSTPAELAVAVPAALLSPRDYVVSVDGYDRAGRQVPVGRYTFRVVPHPPR
jgi:hypothetical protein